VGPTCAFGWSRASATGRAASAVSGFSPTNIAPPETS
jgi:hypothetical protein